MLEVINWVGISRIGMVVGELGEEGRREGIYFIQPGDRLDKDVDMTPHGTDTILFHNSTWQVLD